MVDRDLSVNVTISGFETRWLGDSRVYGWHRNRLIGTDILVSALMALEKWLYDEVEGGRPIDKWLTYLLTNARSVAVLAVLFALAKKHPELLKSALSPLLSCWQAYYWDQRIVAEEDTLNMFFFTWTREGEYVCNLARDWTLLPHRKQLFVQHAIQLLLSEPDLRSSFSEVRENWKRQLGSTRDPTSLELLIARFDPANYRARRLDSCHIAVELEWPQNLKCSTKAAGETADATLRLLNFPARCRNLLDEQRPLSREMLEEFWQDLQRLPNIAAKASLDNPKERLASALVAGVSVLAILHRDWFQADSAREKWCADHLAELFSEPLGRSEFDMRESPSGFLWDSFWGELAVASMAENPDDRNVRIEAAAAVMSFHYDTAQYTMRAAYRLRHRLGEEFQRLQNLAIMYAGISFVARFRADHGLIDDERRNRLTQRYRHRLLNAFVDRKLSATPTSIRPISEHAYDVADREWRRRFKRHSDTSEDDDTTSDEEPSSDTPPSISAHPLARRRYAGVDIQFLQKAFDWLPYLDNARSDDERRSWIHTQRELLSVTLATIEGSDRDESGEIDGTPYPYDNWIFTKVASLIAQMREDEAPEELWHPILDLGPRAHYWVESFLHDWILQGPKASSTPHVFVERWRQLIEYSLVAPSWQDREWTYRLDDLHYSLLGFDYGDTLIEKAEYEDALASLEPVLQQWSPWLRLPHLATGFARCLALAGAKQLVVPGLQWLAKYAQVDRDRRRYYSDELRGALVVLLHHVWNQHRRELESNSQFRDSFLNLLTQMVRAQAPGALELHDHVLRTLPG